MEKPELTQFYIRPQRGQVPRECCWENSWDQWHTAMISYKTSVRSADLARLLQLNAPSVHAPHGVPKECDIFIFTITLANVDQFLKNFH